MSKQKKYDAESEMSADVDALAFARQALKDNDEFIQINDLDGKPVELDWLIDWMVPVGVWAAFVLFVVSVFALSSLN